MIQFLSPPDNGKLPGICAKPGSCQVVSLIGAGGKTSTLFWLARELRNSGLSVLVTTTTHMYLPDDGAVTECMIEPGVDGRLEALRECRPGIVACFSRFDEQTGKVSGCLPEEIAVFKQARLADVILVEADGAKHCWLKAPAIHEPCVPECSDVVIAVSGGDMMLCPADPQRIHRWPLFSALVGIEAGDVLDRQVFDRLLSHPQGMFKGVPAVCARHWLVNLCGSATTQGAGESGAVRKLGELSGMLQSLMETHREIDGIWLGDMRKQQPLVSAWLRSRSDKQEY